jgi:hypothetical protein
VTSTRDIRNGFKFFGQKISEEDPTLQGRNKPIFGNIMLAFGLEKVDLNRN